jgi:hypothetical protein
MTSDLAKKKWKKSNPSIFGGCDNYLLAGFAAGFEALRRV